MDKSYIIKNIIKLGLTLAILVALYVIGCNSVKGETVTDELTPLPVYTPAPVTDSPAPDEEAPSADPPIFYMPPHNSSIQMRCYGWWRNASGVVLYQSPGGSVGSTPPYFKTYSYSDGDVSVITLNINQKDTLTPYYGQYDFDVTVNMNKTPITDTDQFENYKISFMLGSFELLDNDDQSLKVDYSVSISVKVSGVDESGSYISKVYTEIIDRKKFEKNFLAEATFKDFGSFYSINRLDCTLSIECELPEAYADEAPNPKAPHQWYIEVRDLHFTDRLERGVFGMVTSMFIPSTETLSDFVNSKIGHDMPSGYDTALSMAEDVLSLLVSPASSGSTRLTIPPLSMELNGSRHAYFTGGWFDLSNFSYQFGDYSYAGTEYATKIYEWVKTISSILITCEFVYLVFTYFLSLIKSVRFDMLGHYPTDDDITAEEMRHEKIEKWRRRH